MNLPAHPRAVRKFANTISICTNERLGKDSKPPFDSIRVFIASWAMLWSSWGSAAGPPPSPTCKQNARIIVLHGTFARLEKPSNNAEECYKRKTMKQLQKLQATCATAEHNCDKNKGTQTTNTPKPNASAKEVKHTSKN